MNMFKKTIVITNSVLMGSVLTRFVISKLTGWDISVNAFIEMAKPLGIDPTFFRVSTGLVLLVLVIAYFSSGIITLFNNKINMPKVLSYNKLILFTSVLGIGTMAGALLSEFFLRKEPKWLLVYIAIAVITFSAINLFIIKKENYENT